MTGFSKSDSTSASLLQRVRQHDAAAWERLCVLYGPLVYDWCRRRGLQDSDAADAVQEVFQAVFRSIDRFLDREGTDAGRGGSSFRGWFWTIARNQVRLHFRNQRRTPQAFGGSSAIQRLAELAAASDEIANSDETEPDTATTLRWIVHRTLELIRGDFSPTTWEAFTRVTLQGLSTREVAAELGLKENAVRQAKFRVLRRLRDELDGQL